MIAASSARLHVNAGTIVECSTCPQSTLITNSTATYATSEAVSHRSTRA